ncbi:carotenoid oxygenase family protein [Halosegnis sp.]|uniref:carotenoid oxygenase family protein n=1 Tax=Halosegnis sp. TaxID=2864959 RepID=UPI0035D4B1B7
MASDQRAEGISPGYRRGFETQPEERHDVRLPVEGTLPDWLQGRYIANGPGAFEAGDTPLRHWFDAFAMLRSFVFADGEIRYTNRFVRSDDYRYASEHGGVRRMLPGTPADRSVPTRLLQALGGQFQDNPSVGVVRFGDQWLAVTESPVGIQFDPETLETTGRIDLTAGLECDVTLGHLHRDGDRFYNLGVSYDRTATYTLFERSSDGGAPSPLTRLRFETAPYVHSFAITERYAVITVNPVGLDTTRLLTGAVTGDTFLDALEPLDAPLRFVVLDRTSGDHVQTVAAPSAFVYHHANAYETAAGIVVDCVAYEGSVRPLTALSLSNLRAADPDLPTGHLVRYQLPLDGSDATRQRILKGPVEFPTIDYAHDNGRPYNNLYAAETAGTASLPTGLVRVTPDDGDTTRWSEPDTYPGEPVFVPGPDGASGVLLSVLLDPDAERSLLVVLDAAEMTELARAPLPHRLPYGFHGQFYGPIAPGRSMN